MTTGGESQHDLAVLAIPGHRDLGAAFVGAFILRKFLNMEMAATR